MKRTIFRELLLWKDDAKHKPLLIRGARQVGKTYIVRELGKSFPDFAEINFELKPEAGKVFEKDLDPHRIIRDLALFTKKKIVPGHTLLFLDEIQHAPNAVNALRYFYEMLPELHVMAAGSLLDFHLELVGMPVGRVESVYMYPFSFLEFLEAKNEEILLEALVEHNSSEAISDAAHDRLMTALGEYMTVGGMPEAVDCFVQTADLNRCFKIHQTIVDAYRQDFNKYARKYQLKYVELLFDSIPGLLGKKFKYSAIPGEYRKRELMPALDLLIKAGLVNRVTHSSGQGIPLATGSKEETFKMIFLDVALSQNVMGVDSGSWILEAHVNFVNKGALTEAFVGQELLAYSPAWQKSRLFYWQREARASNAEVDYLTQDGGNILPLEVKSGPTGALKSLHVYLDSHANSPYGIRFSTSNFLSSGDIRNYPLYAISKLFS